MTLNGKMHSWNPRISYVELPKTVSIPPSKPITVTFPSYQALAERALKFLVDLNLQDHPRAQQREQLDVIRELRQALRPEKLEK